MAGRNRMPRQPENLRGPRDIPPPIYHRGPPGPHPPHPIVLEEELELQHRDIQRIISENRHVVDENVHLQRELTAVREEIHRLGQVIIPKLEADKDAQARELIERGLKLENELRAVEPVRAEAGQLRAEAQQLNALRQDLSTQVQSLTKDVNRLQSENQQLIALRSDIDEIRKELGETRRVFEYEKKANEEQLEQKQAMEKNLVSIAREIEKLRSEQLSAERRARGLVNVGGGGGGGYGMMNGSPETGRYHPYGGDVYGSGGGAWGSYDSRGPPPRR